MPAGRNPEDLTSAEARAELGRMHQEFVRKRAERRARQATSG